MHGRREAGTTGVDEAFAAVGRGIGVEIMGRNKFGPQRGPWTDEEWQGWWGDDPVVPHPGVRADAPPAPADRDAGRHDVPLPRRRAGGGARRAHASGRRARRADRRRGPTVREFLAADLVDHMHLAVVPVVLGRGERLWDGLEGLEERFDVEAVSSPERRRPPHLHPQRLSRAPRRQTPWHRHVRPRRADRRAAVLRGRPRRVHVRRADPPTAPVAVPAARPAADRSSPACPPPAPCCPAEPGRRRPPAGTSTPPGAAPAPASRADARPAVSGCPARRAEASR